MNRKKIISATLALTIGFSGTYAIAPFANEVKAAEGAIQAAFEVNTDVAVQKSQLDDFSTIKGFFSEETVDLSQVKSFYEENFQTAVQERDVVADENISAMLELGVQDEATAGQVKQAVDKGLQWFFYNEIRHFDREAGAALAEGNIELAQENLDKAVTLFEGSVYVTAGKRDSNFDTLTQDFFENIAVPNMRASVENNDETSFHVWRQYFEKTMMKVFVLATTRYANKIPVDHAAGDLEKEMVHMAEGYFFYMPIHDYLAGGDQEAADNIKAAFSSGDGATVNANDIEKWLTQAITVKVNGYINAAINKDLASGNLGKALIHAAEGNAFASQLELFIKQELGTEAYSDLQMYGENFYNAVEENNVEAATKSGADITNLLNQLSGNQLANFETIKGYFSADEVDLEQVKAFYENNFQALVNARNTQINDEIMVVLEAGVNGDATAGQVKQAVDKGLQWYFYDEINHLVRSEAGAALEAGSKEQAMNALDQALILFNGSVYVTAGKRDGNFDTLTQDFLENVAVEGLKQSIENGDVTSFNVYRQYFQKTMMKVFVLATTRYAHKVPVDHAAGDIEAEKAHLAEGYFFFMPIYNYLAGGDQEAADNIKAAFSSGDGAKVDPKEIEEGLTKAITVKVNGYIDSAIHKDLASGNLDKALVHAAEANAFASQLELFINDQLGAEGYVALQTAGEQFYLAVSENDSVAAEKHGAEITALLARLDGNQSTEVVNDETADIEDTVYIVNKGDTLSEISVEFGLDWKELAEYNSLENPHLILINQEILIPSK